MKQENKKAGNTPQVVKRLEDGKYSGQIIDIKQDKSSGFDYTRYTIELKDCNGQSLSVSFPTKVSIGQDNTPVSQHAVFLNDMGVNLSPETDIDDECGLLFARDVSFLVANKKKGDKTYAEIVKGTIKPLQAKLK